MQGYMNHLYVPYFLTTVYFTLMPNDNRLICLFFVVILTTVHCAHDIIEYVLKGQKINTEFPWERSNEYLD